MAKLRNKKRKVEEVMKIDNEPFSSGQKKEEELQQKGTQLHWELEYVKARFKEVTGNDFKPGEREIEVPKHDFKILQHDFSCRWERIPEEVDESTLRPLAEACVGCGTRSVNENTFTKLSRVCKTCRSKQISKKNYVDKICTGIPQLKNLCVPVWTSGIQLQSCQRCLFDRLGRSDIDNSPPPLSTQEGGFARFQDLAQIDLKGLFGDAETGAVLCRVMNFSVQNERVLANFLLKYHRNDVRLKTSTGLRQIVTEGAYAAIVNMKKKSKDIKFDLVKLEERRISWAPEFYGWTPDGAREYNDFCFADILATAHLESMPDQGIKTQIVNLSFTMNQQYEYISLSGLKFHLANRGATIEWVPALDGKMWNSEGSNGEIYIEGIELKDGIYIYVGNTVGNRHHNIQQRTSLVEYKTLHPLAKRFKTTLYYPENKDNLRLPESQFMMVFLLAQLHDCPFKNFSSPVPATTTFTNCSSLEEFSPAKPIKVINNNIIGKNYTMNQLNDIGNFSSVLLKWKAEISYDWNSDQLKYVTRS